MARTAGALLGRSEDSGNKTFAGHMTRKGESCEQREGEGFCLCSAAAPPAPFFFFYLSKQASKQGEGKGGRGGTRSMDQSENRGGLAQPQEVEERRRVQKGKKGGEGKEAEEGGERLTGRLGVRVCEMQAKEGSEP